MNINSVDYRLNPDGLILYAGSAETTATGERIFVASPSAIGYALADGSEAVAQCAGAIAISMGQGTRAIAAARGAQARALSEGAIAIATNNGTAIADNGGKVWHERSE